MGLNAKSITRKLKFFAAVWISFPIVFLLFSVVAYRVDSAGLAKILLAPGFWFTSFMAVWSGFAMRQILWYTWYVFLFSNFIIAYQVAIVLAYYSNSNHGLILFSATAVLQLIGVLLVGSEIRVPYYSPRIRWWESNPRYKLSLKANLRILGENTNTLNHEQIVEIVDFSRGGCFIKTNHAYRIDTSMMLSFVLFDKPFECMGQAVWSTDSTITHPKGVGIRFINLDRQTSKALKSASHRLQELARNQTQMIREKNWEEYLEREKQFQDYRNRGRRS